MIDHFNSHIFPILGNPTKVKIEGKILTRHAMVVNERVLIHGVSFLGSRVSVDVVCMHLQALYDFMQITIDGVMVEFVFVKKSSLNM